MKISILLKKTPIFVITSFLKKIKTDFYMNKKLILLAILCCGLIFNMHAQKKQSYLLNYTFKKGNIYYMELTTTQQIKMSGMDMPQEMIFGTEFEVIDTDEKGNATLKMTYTRVKFEQQNPQVGKISYDSNEKEKTNESSKTMAQAFAQVLDKYVIVKMKPTGEIAEVIGGDETLKQAFQKENNFATYPTKKLKIGDSWTFKQEKNMSGTDVIITSKNMLKEVKDGQFFLEGKSEIKDKKGKKIGDMTSKSTLKQDDIMISLQKISQKLPNFEIPQGKMSITSDITMDSKKK